MNIFAQIVKETGDYDGPAVIDSGRTVSYQALLRDVREFAATLSASGVRPGARVGIVAEDSCEYIAASLAVLALEASIVPLSTRASADELHSMPQKVGINVLLRDAAHRGKDDISLPLPGNFRNALWLSVRDPEIRPVELPDGRIPAFIRFSSGTTGGSKGVVLSHHAVLERTSACVGLGVTRGEHVLWVLDMAFHFVVTILLFLRKGAAIVICGRPVESRMRDALRDHPVSLLYATPYHYRLMIHSADFQPDALNGIRLAVSTAMTLDAADAEAFRQKFRRPLSQAYGIIEIGLPCINDSADAASVGRLQPAYEVRIENPDAEGKGDILIRGPGMFDAYLSPFCLRAELCKDGWFRTGDVGYTDAADRLFIVGRSKNVIIFAGMKIFPYEVEAVLNEHPLIRESRVSGMKTPGFGELPVAEIVAEGELPADWQTEFRKYCFARLAVYKVPKQFTIVPSLPRTASGKIRRS
ncbi:MAG: class I adenylate-forming enzyme family protein [Victivallales bacterium]